MKRLLILIATVISTQALAGNVIPNLETAVGAESIARQVLNKKILGKDGMKTLKFALEGSGQSPIRSDIASISCDTALGSQDCVIHLNVWDYSRPKGFQDISWEFTAKVYQGTVTGVYMTTEP